MVSETIEIGGTEVEVTETDDGFEAKEVADEQFYVRVESTDGAFGFQIPLAEADQFKVALGEHADGLDDGYNPVHAIWNTDADVSDMSGGGASAYDAFEDADREQFDGHAVVDSVEIVFE